jgi:hypothetical protein
MTRESLSVILLGTLLSIGCASTAEPPLAPARSPQELIEPPPPVRLEGAILWGKVKEVNGSTLILTLRQGQDAKVDLSEAVKLGRTIVPVPGQNVMVNGTVADGVLRAKVMSRAKGESSWGVDRPE